MLHRLGIFLVLVLGMTFVWTPALMADDVDEEIPRVTKEELKGMLATPGVTLIDVRYEKNWEKSDTKIAGAVREHPNEIGSWVAKYDPEQTIVLYCD